VRVRLLLDDLGTNADDQMLLVLSSHPNLKIRLFNPVANRRFKTLGTAAEFARVNRRMHNKALIADNQGAILGGRNIGVHVTVLTNSLAATDVAAVHAGYQRYRKPLLEADVQLYELKPAATGSGTADRKKSVFGSSKSSLHAKTYVFGRKGVFIGSMNFDPRSVELNTEIGVYCESDRAAGQVTDHVESNAIGPVMSRIRAPVCEHTVSAPGSRSQSS
jgi:phosphatidylserine/phosphatidylglycerophosphate/cardiolipin synthase-like enzyme